MRHRSAAARSAKIGRAADLQFIKRDEQAAPGCVAADLVRERRERLCEGARISQRVTGAGIYGDTSTEAGRSAVDRGEALQRVASALPSRLLLTNQILGAREIPAMIPDPPRVTWRVIVS